MIDIIDIRERTERVIDGVENGYYGGGNTLDLNKLDSHLTDLKDIIIEYLSENNKHFDL